MENKKIRVAITHGDTNGIGYEQIFKAFAEPQMFDLCTPIVYGSPKIAAYHRKALGMQANFSIINKAEEAAEGRLNILASFDDEVKVDIGVATDEAANAAGRAMNKALDDYDRGCFDVLVAGPEGCAEGCSDKIGQRLAQHFGNEQAPDMILVNDVMRITTATAGLRIKDVAEKITKERLTKRIEDFDMSLKRDFSLYDPRIAVLALNPCADGHEEKEVIAPVVEELYDKGVEVFGPYAANDFFANAMYESFDGIMAMYDDQALIAFNTLSNECGINSISGTPIVCATPAHGACHDLAGRMEADETPLRHSIYLAVDMLRNRTTYDKPLANPLKKLYHEKRDDSEKVRFSIPKHENNEKA